MGNTLKSLAIPAYRLNEHTINHICSPCPRSVTICLSNIVSRMTVYDFLHKICSHSSFRNCYALSPSATSPSTNNMMFECHPLFCVLVPSVSCYALRLSAWSSTSNNMNFELHQNIRALFLFLNCYTLSVSAWSSPSNNTSFELHQNIRALVLSLNCYALSSF